MRKLVRRLGILFLSILSIFLILIVLAVFVVSRTDSFTAAGLLIDALQWSMHPGYKIKNHAVYFKSCNEGNGCTLIKLKLADPNTFKVLEKFGYAKDDNHVYFQEDIVKGADPASLKVLSGDGGDWAIDKNHVYNDGELVKGADPKTFRVIKTKSGFYDLGSDKSHIVMSDGANPACDPGSLRQLSSSASWQIDDKCIYYEGKLVKGGDPNSLKVLDKMAEEYAEDNNHVYYMGKPIIGADVKTFSRLKYDFSKDKNHVYFFGELVKGANPASFKLILDPGSDGSFERDDKHVYFQGKLIRGANPSSFRVLDKIDPLSNYSETSNHVYSENKIIPGASPKTFQVLGLGFAKNEKHVYLYGDIVKFVKDPKTFELLPGGECARDKYHFYDTDDGSILKGASAKECQWWINEEKDKKNRSS